MGTSLIELVDDFNKISTAILRDFEEGNDSGEALLVELQALNLTIKDKVDSYKYVLDRLKDEGAYWKERSKKASGVSKAIDNATGYIKDRIKFAMEQMDAPEVLGNEFRFKIQKNQPSLVIDSVEALPAKYKVQVVSEEILKADLKADLKAGEEIPGARLEVGESVRAYVNRKK